MGRKKGSKNKQPETEKPADILSNDLQDAHVDSIAHGHGVIDTQIVADAIDDLLKAELAKIEGMKEPGKSSVALNLKRYYNAQRKSKE